MPEEEKKGKLVFIQVFDHNSFPFIAAIEDEDEEIEEQVEFLGKAPKRKDTRTTYYRK